MISPSFFDPRFIFLIEDINYARGTFFAQNAALFSTDKLVANGEFPSTYTAYLDFPAP